jgi:putative ABC transport system permease protein
MVGSFSLLVRLTARDMRGSWRHFRLFVLAIFLGVLAIASVGFLSDLLLGGLANDAKRLLGGDVAITLNQRQLSDDESKWIAQSGQVSRSAGFRSMARFEGKQRLVQVKAVDEVYPLVGTLDLENGVADVDTLGRAENLWGAFADSALQTQLTVGLGGIIQVGDARFQLRGWIEREPDRSLVGFELGPRVMISTAALADSGFEKPGSLIKNTYKVLLSGTTSASNWLSELNQQFPEAGWRIRSLTDATPGVSETIERLTQFLTLIGLTTLLVCAVGSGNAVQAYLARKVETQAIFKTLGAGQKLLFLCFFLQVLVMSIFASLLALIVGYFGSMLAAPYLTNFLNIDPAPQQPFLIALLSLAFGTLVALTFSFLALARVPGVPVARLFRGSGENDASPGLFGYLGTLILGSGLIALAVFSAFDPMLAAWFLVAAAAVLLSLWLLAKALLLVTKRIARPKKLSLKMALSNLVRPGSPTTATIVTLGLGLTLLVAIAQTDSNLRRQVSQDLPQTTPAFFMIDIQKAEADQFREFVSELKGASDLAMVPLLRGAITRLKSVPVEDLDIPDSIDWVFEGDRGLTWAREPTETMDVVEGDWWPTDYSGKPLISLDREVAELMNLKIGDAMTVNILGRDIEVEIANFRKIEWRSFGINFVVVFSPGLLEKAPQTYLATLVSSKEDEDRVESAIIDAFPTVSSIRVRRTLGEVSRILGTVANLLGIASFLTLIAAIIVISGAIMTSRQKRSEEMVIFKVLGATKAQVLRAFIVEYGLMGFLSAGLAAVLGLTGSYLIVTKVMDGDFQANVWSLLGILLLGTLLTVALGFIGTFYNLSMKASTFLRND